MATTILKKLTEVQAQNPNGTITVPPVKTDKYTAFITNQSTAVKIR